MVGTLRVEKPLPSHPSHGYGRGVRTPLGPTARDRRPGPAATHATCRLLGAVVLLDARRAQGRSRPRLTLSHRCLADKGQAIFPHVLRAPKAHELARPATTAGWAGDSSSAKAFSVNFITVSWLGAACEHQVENQVFIDLLWFLTPIASELPLVHGLHASAGMPGWCTRQQCCCDPRAP